MVSAVCVICWLLKTRSQTRSRTLKNDLKRPSWPRLNPRLQVSVPNICNIHQIVLQFQRGKRTSFRNRLLQTNRSRFVRPPSAWISRRSSPSPASPPSPPSRPPPSPSPRSRACFYGNLKFTWPRIVPDLTRWTRKKIWWMLYVSPDDENAVSNEAMPGDSQAVFEFRFTMTFFFERMIKMPDASVFSFKKKK